MREITKDACEALKSNQNFERDNTTVRTYGKERPYAEMQLHGHMVAATDDKGRLYVTLAGHPTLTTRERVNGAMERWGWPVRIVQRSGRQYMRHLETNKYHPIHPNYLISMHNVERWFPDGKGE